MDVASRNTSIFYLLNIPEPPACLNKKDIEEYLLYARHSLFTIILDKNLQSISTTLDTCLVNIEGVVSKTELYEKYSNKQLENQYLTKNLTCIETLYNYGSIYDELWKIIIRYIIQDKKKKYIYMRGVCRVWRTMIDEVISKVVLSYPKFYPWKAQFIKNRWFNISRLDINIEADKDSSVVTFLESFILELRLLRILNLSSPYSFIQWYNRDWDCKVLDLNKLLKLLEKTNITTLTITKCLIDFTNINTDYKTLNTIKLFGCGFHIDIKKVGCINISSLLNVKDLVFNRCWTRAVDYSLENDLNINTRLIMFPSGVQHLKIKNLAIERNNLYLNWTIYPICNLSSLKSLNVQLKALIIMYNYNYRPTRIVDNLISNNQGLEKLTISANITNFDLCDNPLFVNIFMHCIRNFKKVYVSKHISLVDDYAMYEDLNSRFSQNPTTPIIEKLKIATITKKNNNTGIKYISLHIGSLTNLRDLTLILDHGFDLNVLSSLTNLKKLDLKYYFNNKIIPSYGSTAFNVIKPKQLSIHPGSTDSNSFNFNVIQKLPALTHLGIQNLDMLKIPAEVLSCSTLIYLNLRGNPRLTRTLLEAIIPSNIKTLILN